MILIRYWFNFDITLADSPPPGTLIGCGVTAENRDAALKLIGKVVFKGKSIPDIKNCVENVDISSLDTKHVLANMGNSTIKGIWFPIGYQY